MNNNYSGSPSWPLTFTGVQSAELTELSPAKCYKNTNQLLQINDHDVPSLSSIARAPLIYMNAYH